jgi:hypothetical protein
MCHLGNARIRLIVLQTPGEAVTMVNQILNYPGKGGSFMTRLFYCETPIPKANNLNIPQLAFGCSYP